MITTHSQLIESLRHEKRVYRSVGIPVTAFDALQKLKRRHNLATNSEALTYALIMTEESEVTNYDSSHRPAGI